MNSSYCRTHFNKGNVQGIQDTLCLSKFKFAGSGSYLRSVIMICVHVAEFFKDFHSYLYLCSIKLHSSKSNNFYHIQAPCRSSWVVYLYDSP